MGDANLATVQAMFEAFGSRDNDAVLDVYDPEVVWDARGLTRLPDLQGIFHGVEGVKRWWRVWLEAWDAIDILDAPQHEQNGNQVVSTWVQRNRGRGSGVEVEMESGIVWTFETGRIVRVAVFGSRAEARAAAGLAPG